MYDPFRLEAVFCAHKINWIMQSASGVFYQGIKNIVLLLCVLFSSVAICQQPAELIRLNQLGFYPTAPKEAVIVGAGGKKTFYIKDAVSKKTSFTGKLSNPIKNPLAEKSNVIADFSDFQQVGKYFMDIPGLGQSYPFEIKKDVHRNAAIGALKGFYYQRTFINLEPRYAGKWARAAGHPDTAVYIHSSAATAQRREGTVISSPLGWYDAGDYNKYVVNSGITVATLLSLYEDFPDGCKSFKTNIPESGNVLPDVLDEALFNLRWMLTMQDPNDGGVYHKLTNANFDALDLLPARAQKKRYVVQKSTAATLDFAAVMAQASRIFTPFAKEMPHFADSCLAAAQQAWQWAQQHPDVQYDQTELNKLYEPDITTGEYGDKELSDEWIWAAIELWTTTQKEEYKAVVNFFPDTDLPLPAWNEVRILGYYTLLRLPPALSLLGERLKIEALKKNLLSLADTMVLGALAHPFHTVMGRSERDYTWGSNAVAANQGIFLIQAYKLSKDQKYLRAALTNLDYLLGRNATGYCFLTGFGQKQVLHPHHRPSVADNIIEPVPGLLSGGPNPGQQDECPGYTTKVPDKSFMDDQCSYSTNEIAINWNAPLVYLIMAMEILQNRL